MRSKRNRSRSRSGVLRLNSGSSPYGRSNVLNLNQPGGSFFSGRTAGGAAGDPITRALAAPSASIEGPIGDQGPPPQESFSQPVAQEQRPLISSFPEFKPQPYFTGIRSPSPYPIFLPPRLPQPSRSGGRSSYF